MKPSEEGFRERGIFRSVEEMVAEAGEMVALAVAEVPLERAGGEPTRQFTQDEAMALARGGLDLSRASRGSALARTAARHAALMASALTEPEAASILGVSESRVRQRVGEGTLYAVRVGRDRRLARFQFFEGGPVPGAGEVLREVPDGAHPLAVEGWFTSPDPDLILGGAAEDPGSLSPKQWLLLGGPAEALKPLAAEL